MPFVAIIIINIIIDIFIYRHFRKQRKKAALVAHTALSVAMIGIIVATVAIALCAGASNAVFVTLMWLLFCYFSIYIAKYVGLIVGVFLLIPKLSRRTRRFVARCGTVAAYATLFLMIWSAAVTPYTYRINRIELASPRLPKEFNGYKIVQFSDTHLGTYCGRTAFVRQCVDAINALSPDAICFTGDLVSRHSSEAHPYRDILKKLHAKDGVFAVLGNHDYDDYMPGITEAERDADRKALRDFENGVGWKLLCDEHVIISRDSARIAIIGTENYGEPPFPKYGSLERAYPNANDSVYKILLQHNPQSWRDEIAGKTSIDLMLAGHTHAMQFLISFFGNSWSPAKWKYAEWGGLYHEKNQALYVNIGLGMVGFPARIGATPEITVITLRSE